MEGWILFWQALWYVGLVVFSVLSVVVAIFGASDLVHLLKHIRTRHMETDD